MDPFPSFLSNPYLQYLKFIANFMKFDCEVKLTTQNLRTFSGAARNRGWRLATSEWVVFLDADDTYVINMLKIIKNAIDICGDANLILHGYQYNNKKFFLKKFESDFVKIDQIVGPAEILQSTLEYMKNQNTLNNVSSNIAIPFNSFGITEVHHGHATVRNSIYDEIKYKEIQKAEDGLFCRDVLFSLGGVYFIPAKLSIYNDRFSSWRDKSGFQRFASVVLNRFSNFKYGKTKLRFKFDRRFLLIKKKFRLYYRKILGLKSVLNVYKSHGFISALIEIRNLYKSWSIYDLSNNFGIMRNGLIASSTSDTFNYNHICEIALTDNKIFKRFKSCIEYQKILEHVSIDLGYKYWSNIQSRVERLSEDFEFLIRFDKCNPPKQWYQGLGVIPSSNLRYAKVSLDLQEYFGSLDNFTICEIGPGYGGQAFQICYLNKVVLYELVDLPVATSLAKKYLNTCPVKTDFESYLNGEKFRDFDLVISNYAFSELRRDVQDFYLETYILGSKRGYITFNQETPKEWGSYTIQELNDRIPNLRVIPDLAQDEVGGAILIWDRTSLV